MPSDAALYRRAALFALTSSFPAALGICALVTGRSSVVIFAKAFPLQIASAYGVMAAFVWLLAPFLGPACTRRIDLAGLAGVVVLFVGVLSGSLTSLVVYRDSSFHDYVLKPLRVFGLYGSLPAFILGIAACLLSRNLFSAREPR